MVPPSGFRVLVTTALAGTLAAFGCTPADGGVQFEDSGVKPASGGATVPGSGGASSGGAPGSGGAANSGGAPGSGGRGSGGASQSGGASGTGGRGSGGAASGGSGAGTGGSGTGGRAAGGSGTGGRGGAGTGTGGAGGGSAATFSAVATILGTSCGTGTCHMGGAHVDLRNTAGLRDRIVSQMVSGTMSMTQCRTKTYVVPNDTANSVISQIVKAQVSGCGARMPDNCSTSSSNPRACLTTAQIATIDAWINAGAPP